MAVSYNTSIVKDGLVFYIDAANSRSYPGSGNIWYDISSNGNNATLVNSPTFSNNTIQFRSASSQYAYAFFDFGVLRQTNELGMWTIEALFKHRGVSTGIESFIAGRAGCHGGIYVDSSNNIRHAIKTTEASCWTGAVNSITQTMAIDSWYHTVMVYENGFITSYINGRKVLETTFDRNTYNMAGYGTQFIIGGITSNFTNSDISIIRCYNMALSSNQVSINYASLAGRMI